MATPPPPPADPPAIIDLDAALAGRPLVRRCWRAVGPLAARVLALDWVNDCYRRTHALAAASDRGDDAGGTVDDLPGPDRPAPPAGFFERALEACELRYEIADGDPLRIPAEGPVVVVANHPLGGADAVILADLLSKLRPDARLLANFLVGRIPEARPWLIEVDPFEGESASRRNLAPLRRALAHLKEGGLLAVFPAGEVSRLDLRARRVRDRPWSCHVASLVRRTGATVVPVCFEGRNSALFQIGGLVHPLARTLQLPRELRRLRGRTLRLRIGKPIRPARLPADATDRELADFLRLRTDVLAESSRLEKIQRTRTGQTLRPGELEPLVAPEPPTALRDEIAALPSDALLVHQDEWRVLAAPAALVPRALREIGRLRETTFREVGEGTGRSIDLDAFDETYRHLFLWNAETLEIAGAYRLGLTDEIVRDHGIHGLYTRSLFRFKPEFVRRLDPAIELGRSFITAKYQRKLSSLFLLWRGIGEFVARHPRYRILFGPVSISQDYHALSRNLIVRFMRERLRHPELARLVKASHPPETQRLRHLERSQVSASLRSIEDVSALVSEIEGDGKGIPILLKHYVKMSAALLSFNVDDSFGGVIDGLMVADLLETDPRLLRRYLGTDGATRFREFHLGGAGTKAVVESAVP